MKTRISAFFIILIFLLIFSSPTFAQFGNETITITTYYPSPHGVYGVLTLYPRSAPPDQDTTREGDLYYDDGTYDSVNRTKGVYVYDGGNWTKTSIGGGGGGGGSGGQTDTGGVEYNGTAYKITLATPIKEKVDILTMPEAAPVIYPGELYPPCRGQLGYCRDSDNPMEFGRYSFSIDRSGIQAVVQPSLSRNCSQNGRCSCGRTEMFLDGVKVFDGCDDMTYTTGNNLPIGQHTITYTFKPDSCWWKTTSGSGGCIVSGAKFYGGTVTLSREISEVLIPDSSYK